MFGPGGSFFVWVGGMNGGRDERTAVPLAVCPFWFFGGVRCGGLTGGGGPSALRWMAAGAEFPCGVLGGCGLSALRWMVAGAEFPCGVPGGEGHRRCGGCSGMRFWRFLSKGFC